MINDSGNEQAAIVPSVQPQQNTKPVLNRVKMRSALQNVDPFKPDTQSIAIDARSVLTNVVDEVLSQERRSAEEVVGEPIVRLLAKLKEGSDNRVKSHITSIESGVMADIAANFQTDRSSLELAFDADTLINELLAA